MLPLSCSSLLSCVLQAVSVLAIGLDVVARDDAFFHKDKYF